MKDNDNKKERIPLKVLWHHPFYNSLIKLGIWFIFFLILYIFLIVNSKRPIPKEYLTNEEPASEITYSDMKKNFTTKELNINYVIEDYYISGIIKDNVLTATLEDNTDTVIKIKYDGNKLYQIKKEEEIEANNLLENININYLLPTKIINIIDDPKVISTKNAEGLVYKYDIDNIVITVYLNEKSIEKITILENDIAYNLEYKEVVNEK